MQPGMFLILRGGCLALFLSVLGLHTLVGDPQQWTPETSVSVRYFVENPERNLEPWNLRTGEGDVIVPSPDGRFFFFVSFHGDLSADRMSYELSVFSVETVRHTTPDSIVPPLRRLQMASPRGGRWHAGIIQPKWEGSSAIRFLGEGTEGGRQLYEFDVATGELHRLTNAPADVLVAFYFPGFVARGRTVLTLNEEMEPWKPLERYPASSISEGELSQLFSPEQSVGVGLYVNNAKGTQRIARSSAVTVLGEISPDEQKTIAVFPPVGMKIPTAWSGYEFKPQQGHRFMLLDFRTGKAEPVFDAPAGAVTTAGRGRANPFAAFWSADSRHVLLFNTALPLGDLPEGSHMSYVVDYNVETRTWDIVAPLVGAGGEKIAKAAWSPDRTKVELSRQNAAGTNMAPLICRYVAGRWVSAVEETASAYGPIGFPVGFKVQLRQGRNSSPAIVAFEGERQWRLTGDDPALAGIRWSLVELFIWQDPDGKEARGLFLVPNREPGAAPPPLVVQICDPFIEPDFFRPDGSGAESGLAAQSLAAEGFAVLQIESVGDTGIIFSPREGPAQVARIDAAVAALGARIDSTRVGLMGFSRSGYLTYYAVTHPGKTHIGAAMVFDSITASYGEYVTLAGVGDLKASGWGSQYGTGSFWENKQGWLDAPAFNVDRCTTPVLFGSTARLSALETIGAFRYCHRPFDFLFFPEGTHLLQRPQERLAAMRAHVDWMNFWLQEREAGGEREEQFVRWRRIRDAWNATCASEQKATIETPH